MVLYTCLPIGDMGRFEWTRILVMFLALIGDLGLGAALVQRRDSGDDHFDAAFWTSLTWGLGITALVLATAPLMAPFLGGENPEEFTRELRILCLLIPFASVSGLFRARLQRDLNFSAIAVSEVVSVLSFSLLVVLLLFMAPHMGVLIPVVGSIFREVGLLVSLCLSARWRPGFRFCARALRELLYFALHFTGSRAVANLNTNISSLFIFQLIGSSAMGYYRLAAQLTLQPLTRLATTLFRVSFPTFATIQDDDDLLRRGYLHSVQSLVLTMGPLLAGLFVFAPELLQFLDKTPALTVLRLLAAATLLKVVGTMVGSVFLAKGKTNWSFYWSLFSLAVLIPSMYFSVPYGIEGIAGVIAATSLLFLLLSQGLANRLIHLSFTAYLAALCRPALVVLVLFAVLAAAHPLLPGPSLVVLIQGALLGLLTGILCLRLFAWNLCCEFWRRLRGRGGIAPSGIPPDSA